MADRYLARGMARGNRNLALAGLVMLAAVGGVGWSMRDYWRELRRGPMVVSDVALAGMPDPLQSAPSRWVTLDHKLKAQVAGTVKSGRSRLPSAYYNYLPLSLTLHTVVKPVPPPLEPITRPATKQEAAAAIAYAEKHGDLPITVIAKVDKALLVRSKLPIAAAGRLTGDLRRPNEEERDKLSLDRMPGLMPVVLSVENYRIDAWGMLALGGLVALWGLLLIRTAIRRAADPTRHWSWRQLSPYGEPGALAQQLEEELSSDGTACVLGRTRLTSHWVVRPRFSGVDAMALDAVVWAYEKVTQHRSHGIPTGKEFAAVLADRFGRQIVLSERRPVVEEILGRVAYSRRGILCGYSEQLAGLYTNELEQMVAMVDSRRAEAAQQEAGTEQSPAEEE